MKTCLHGVDCSLINLMIRQYQREKIQQIFSTHGFFCKTIKNYSLITMILVG